MTNGFPSKTLGRDVSPEDLANLTHVELEHLVGDLRGRYVRIGQKYHALRRARQALDLYLSAQNKCEVPEELLPRIRRLAELAGEPPNEILRYSIELLDLAFCCVQEGGMIIARNRDHSEDVLWKHDATR